MFTGTNRVETRGNSRPSVARKEQRKAGKKNGPDAVQHPTRQMKVRDNEPHEQDRELMQ